MKKVINRIITIFIIISTIYITKAYAAGSFNISASKSSINKGESVTISIKANNAYGQIDIKAKNGTVSPSSVFLQNGNDTKTVTVTSTSDSDIEVVASPGSSGLGDIDENPISGSQSLTIKVNKQNSTSNSNNNSSSNNQSNAAAAQSNASSNSNASNNTATVNKSTEARLKNMGIKEKAYDFTGFKRDRKEYSIEVPNKISELTVYATPVDSKAKVAGTGKVSLKEGDNTVAVTVTAEAGNTETYNLKIKRNTTAEDAAGPTEQQATDNVSGAFGLSSLDIEDVELNPEFDTEIYQYTVDLNKDLSSLEIETIATADDTTVEIVGNENLHEGENTITILVKNKKTNQTATYQITVNKNVASEEGKNEPAKEMNWLQPSTWGKEEKIKVIIMTVLIILIIIAIILKVKLVKEKKAQNNIDFPGADELDKAIAEHQELSELDEETDEMDFEIDNFGENTENAGKEWQEDQNFEDLDGRVKETENKFDTTNYLEDIARSKNYDIDIDLDYKDDFKNSSKRRGKGKHF